MERKKQKLEDREKSISKEQKKCKEKLQVAGWLYVEANRRLQKAIKDKAMGQRSLLFEAWWRR